ncbi:Sapep family Mn(2+)-dependent dipeptidase [bacterium]|nr:Sapep family Mn(2+)-dependent dipeptidase [bacterium]
MESAPRSTENPANKALAPQQINELVAAFMEEHRDELLADSTRILQFETVSGGSPEQEAKYQEQIPACFEWLGERAHAMGFEFRVVDNLAGEISWPHPDPNAPIYDIATHIDVVTPVGEWTYPPFSGEIADGHLWGRGIQDDKGPLIQSLYGLWALKEAGIQLPCTVNIVIGTTEETSDWGDIARYLELNPAPNFAFTPDANFPIINGEKGMISVQLDADWTDEGPHAETGMEFVSLIGGERENIVPSVCELTLRFPADKRAEVMKELVRATTEYTVEHSGANITLLPNKERALGDGRCEAVVTFLGKGTHSSTPEKGHNAILDALDFMKSITTFPESVRKYAGFLYIAGSDLTGTNLNLHASHHFIGDTTVSLSLLEMDAEKGRSVLNVRPTMGLLTAETLKRCAEAGAEYGRVTGLEIKASKRGKAKDAIFLDPENEAVAPYIKALQQGYELVTGEKGELKATAGTTYAKAIPNCCAFGPILSGVEPELAHQADERMPVESIIRNARIYGTAMGLLAATE